MVNGTSTARSDEHEPSKTTDEAQPATPKKAASHRQQGLNK